MIIESAGHSDIGFENFLLGLLWDGEGVAARVLENIGVEMSNILTQVIKYTILESEFFSLVVSRKMLKSDLTGCSYGGRKYR